MKNNVSMARKVVQRTLRVSVISIAFVGLVSSSAQALSVVASITVGGKAAGPVTTLRGAKATTVGKTNYDSTVKGIPLPGTAYVLHSVAWYPFQRPVITSTNQPIKAFTVDTNPLTGQRGWNYRNSFDIWGKKSANMTTSAVGDLATGTTVYYNSHGSGKTSGGVAGTDDNALIQVKVK